MLRIPTKSVKHLVNATFPDYKKREVVIDASGKVTFYDLNWGGGTKNEYKACCLDGEEMENPIDMGRPAPWCNPYEGKTIEIPSGYAVVESGFFCGKPSTIHIHINPENTQKFIEHKA